MMKFHVRDQICRVKRNTYMGRENGIARSSKFVIQIVHCQHKNMVVVAQNMAWECSRLYLMNMTLITNYTRKRNIFPTSIGSGCTNQPSICDHSKFEARSWVQSNAANKRSNYRSQTEKQFYTRNLLIIASGTQSA